MRSLPASCALGLAAVFVATDAWGAGAAASPSPSAAAGRCLAQLHSKAHLRSEASSRAAGPTLSPGAKVEVLQNIPLTRRGLSLFQVRVLADGATGYLFLRDTEFGRGCPLVWNQEEFRRPNQPIPPADGSGCYRRGVHADLKTLFARSCREGDSDAPESSRPVIQLEGDHHVRLESYGPREEFAILLQDKQGWRAYSLHDYGSDRHNFGWDKPVRAGSATYLVFSDNVDYEEDGDIEHSESYELYRVLADGRVFSGLSLYLNVGKGAEQRTCTLRGNADASLTIRCRGGRTQTFRWDAAVNRLVPLAVTAGSSRP